MAETEAAAPAPVSYEDLAAIEDEFEEVDVEIMRLQYALSAAAYTKRATAISQIPNFWPLVLEQAPLEIDQYIQPQDSRIFAESLTNLSIRRPELARDGGGGNPRSLSIIFEFRENPDFEDTVLEKEFWYRRAKDGWTGLVSEPVRVRWREGRDLTEGLTDGAVALWDARRKAGDHGRRSDSLAHAALKGRAPGDMTRRDYPEYAALKKKVEQWNGLNTSFFTWFGWVSSRRWVSAEESQKANAAHAAFKAKRNAGDNVLPPAPSQEEIDAEAAQNDDEAVEVHEAGEDLAIAFAEDLWPNAIKFFTQAQEMEEMSDVDFEEEEEDDDDEEEKDGGADEGDEQIVDIRSLVQDKGGKGTRVRESGGSSSSAAGGPPSKKVKM